jgi:protein-disulfide isomerase
LSLNKGVSLELLPLLPTDHIRGREEAPLTLFEFGDYECPGCGEAYWHILRLEETYGDRFRFVFRHYAFAKRHPHAELAAQASEAANAQGKFWDMHDLLFRDQANLKYPDLVARAKSLGLDLARFEHEMKAEKYLDQVRADFRTGVQNGVFGTPGMFINGVRHNGATDFDTLQRTLESSLESQTEPSA